MVTRATEKRKGVAINMTMTDTTTNASTAMPLRNLAGAIAKGMASLSWARSASEEPKLDRESGLWDDNVVLTALIDAIGSIEGIEALN